MAASKISTARRKPASGVRHKTDWTGFDAETDADIAAAVAADPDTAPILTPSWLKQARLVAPAEKQLISIRLDKDVLDHFRAQPKYQTRINAILRLVMEHEKVGRR
jgi:uncharacterized protein (DUF4415 family)